ESRIARFKLDVLSAVDEERATFVRIEETLRLAALSAAEELTATGGCSATLAALARDNPWSTRGLIFDEAGAAICGTDRAISVGDQPFWPEFAARPAFFVASASVGRLSGRRVLRTFSPIVDPSTNAFAIGVGVDIDYLASLTETSPDEPGFALLSKDGAIVAYRGAVGEAAEALADWLPADRSGLLAFGDKEVLSEDAAGNGRAYFTSEVAGGQLWAVAAAPEETAFDILSTRDGLVAVAPFAAFAFVVAAVYWAVGRLIGGHFRRLSGVISAIGAGETPAPPPRSGTAPEEILALEDTLVDMGRTLNERNRTLEEALDVQKRLLLEVHHRIKNNLQTISSLVRIEQRRFSDAATREVLARLQQRLRSLSFVHQNLYSASQLDEVELGGLVGEIASNVDSSLSPRPEATRPLVEADEVWVDTIAATPVALFATEALANAYKHGDPEAAPVRVALRRSENDFELVVSNAVASGRAVEDASGSAVASGLGKTLMSGFASQLDGRFESL
ncbi:MAG: sensor histidine kinase, partial [Pseudomonadota bacterium]